MLDDVVKAYAAYLKLDFSSGINTVQEVVDNMLTRLEELTSVLQMIKLRNSECSASISEDINKYRSDIIMLSKKICTVTEVIHKLQQNVEILENQVEQAEIEFGIQYENRFKSFLKPFLKRNKDDVHIPCEIRPPDKSLKTVLDNFEEKS